MTRGGTVKLGAKRWIIILLGLLGAWRTYGVPVLPLGATSPPQAACENSFAGAVYFDQDANGRHDRAEHYLPGQIEIVDDQGATQQLIQSDDGRFSAHQLTCNTYTIHHNRVLVGTVLVGEVMSGEMQMFPKVQWVYFPVVARGE
jgi:hypothetical protein